MKIKSIKNKNILVATVAAVVLIGGGVFAYKKFSGNDETAASGTNQPTEILNLDPPTDEEKKSANDHKKEIVEQEERINSQQAGSTQSKKAVTPLITYAGQFGPQGQAEVGGYVNGVFEDGGICKATFSRGGASFTRQVQAVKNANSVDCPTISAESSAFNPKGTWSVVLSYESNSATGSSLSKNIDIN